MTKPKGLTGIHAFGTRSRTTNTKLATYFSRRASARSAPELWDRTERHAGIDRQAFMEYFSGKDKGHAIKIGNVRRYEEPRDLQATYGVRPPQSFLYL